MVESEAVMHEMIVGELSQAAHEIFIGFAHLLPRLIVMLVIAAAAGLSAVALFARRDVGGN